MSRNMHKVVRGCALGLVLVALGCSDGSSAENGTAAPTGAAGNSGSPSTVPAPSDAPAPTGVGGDSSSPGMVAAPDCGSESFRAIYNDIFADATNSCTAPSCHGRTMRLQDVGNLDLSTPDIAYSQLVGIGSDGEMCAGKVRVEAGNPQGSLLVTKLRDATVDCGVLMPVGAPVDDLSLMRIVDWISAGACNN